MKQLATRTLGLVICLIAGFLAAVYLVAYCTWDCERDAAYWLSQLVFWLALAGTVFFGIGVFRKLMDNLS